MGGVGKEGALTPFITDSFLLERLQWVQDTELRMADQAHALTELHFLFLQGEAIRAESSARNRGTAEEGCSPRHRDPTLIPIAGTRSGAGFKSSSAPVIPRTPYVSRSQRERRHISCSGPGIQEADKHTFSFSFNSLGSAVGVGAGERVK